MERSSIQLCREHYVPYQALCNAFDILQTEFLNYPGGCLEVSIAALGGSRQIVIQWAQDRIHRRFTKEHTLQRFLRDSQLQVVQSLPFYGNGCVDEVSLSAMEDGFMKGSLRGTLLVGDFLDGTQHAVAVISSVLAAQMPSLQLKLDNHLIVDVNSRNFYTVAPIPTVIHQRGLRSMVGHCIAL